jgi:hypothetical protein
MQLQFEECVWGRQILATYISCVVFKAILDTKTYVFSFIEVLATVIELSIYTAFRKVFRPLDFFHILLH